MSRLITQGDVSARRRSIDGMLDDLPPEAADRLLTQIKQRLDHVLSMRSEGATSDEIRDWLARTREAWIAGEDVMS
ncbi:hypothetical protein FJ930_18360 [Mesorhizobium sp. B2-4-15]|uniref:hypothetical protein n=1 Tax=Mesorhizobium sp. B2-4-15 TaxID=2589934 RepID=UPI00114DB97D|nr:hypothetical protein [Mesorhizobium sp. B2-4-15]TPK70289.1 hypothetical protein FJ930_18360 [Mesorhizobium sp. B2-4-15]